MATIWPTSCSALNSPLRLPAQQVYTAYILQCLAITHGPALADRLLMVVVSNLPGVATLLLSAVRLCDLICSASQDTCWIQLVVDHLLKVA